MIENMSSLTVDEIVTEAGRLKQDGYRLITTREPTERMAVRSSASCLLEANLKCLITRSKMCFTR